MKKVLRIAILMMLLPAMVVAQDTVNTVKKRPTVGLVLGGGGAKGAAHIGVLKYIEELGIPVDYVAGTSIGSIIGGFYSLGYSPEELSTIISGMDWSMYMSNSVDRNSLSIGGRQHKDTYLLSVPFNTGTFKKSANNVFLASLPSGFISGNSLTNLFNSLSLDYHDSISFDSLPIPFACVATDVASGDSLVLRSGVLPMAIRSSMAIPGVFSPVYLDGHVLADGGLIANFPVEVCRGMGADIIIGVDVSDSLVTDYEQLQSLPQLINQYTGIAMKTDVPRLKPMCDLYMHPNITGYSTLSFSTEAIDSLIQRGYQVAAAHREELLAIKNQVDPENTFQKVLHAPKAKMFGNDTVVLARVKYRGIPEEDERWLRINDRIFEEQKVTRADIERVISDIAGTGYYSDITYSVDIIDSSAQYDRCLLTIDLRQAEPHDFSLGLRVDSEESAALLMHVGLNQNRPSGFKMGVNARINHNPRLELVSTLSGRKPLGVGLDYHFHSSHFSIGNNYSRMYTPMTVEHHKLAFAAYRSYGVSARAAFGVEEDINVVDSNVAASEFLYSDFKEIFTSRGHTGIFAQFNVDNSDDGYFPTHGHYLSADAHWRFSDGSIEEMLYASSYYLGFVDFRLDYQLVLPLSSRVVLMPQCFNRVLIGNYKGLYNNMVGGVLRNRYTDHQLPFIGFNIPQNVGDWANVLRMDLRVNIANNQYITLMGNYMMTADQVGDYFSANSSYHEAFGVGLRYSYKLSIGGPISFDLHWSNLTKRVGAYFNFGYIF